MHTLKIIGESIGIVIGVVLFLACIVAAVVMYRFSEDSSSGENPFE